MSAPDLSALVSARLCHDLISPMGAIGNGLELLQLAGGPAGAELALVNDSLATALAKLRFYRVAFGPADPQARQSFEEAAQITDAMFHGRFTVAWERGDTATCRARWRGSPISRSSAWRRACPWAGVVRVGRSPGTAITLAVEGRRTAPPAELWAHVTEGAGLAGAPARRRAVRAAAPGARRPPATGSTARFGESCGRDRHRRSARRWPKPGPEARHVGAVAGRRLPRARRSRPASGRAPPCPAGPTTSTPSGIALPSVTSAPAPTSTPCPITAPFSTVAPMPTRLPSPMVQPCRIAMWPMVQSRADGQRIAEVGVADAAVLHVRPRARPRSARCRRAAPR